MKNFVKALHFITVAALVIRGAIELKAPFFTKYHLVENLIIGSFVVVLNAFYLFRDNERS